MATDDRAIIGGGSMSATYGGRNLLESMTVNSQGITYKLNAFMQRVSEAFSGSTTHYIHDIKGNLIAEANGSTGTTTMEYIYAEGEPLAQVDGSGNLYYLHQAKSGRRRRSPTPAGLWCLTSIIKPFGEVYSTPTNTTPTNIRFPNQYANANNSLYHNGVRDYLPWCGCYIESDPFGLSGGLNPIRYAMANPTQTVDPTGLSSMDATDGDVSIETPSSSGTGAGAAVGAVLARAPEAVAVVGGFGGGLYLSSQIPAQYDPISQAVYGAYLQAHPDVASVMQNENSDDQSDESKQKSMESKPKDCPAGTQGIDQAKGKFGLDHEQVEEIKDSVQMGPKDWVGIAPNGNVITNNPESPGTAKDNGHWSGLTNY